MDLEYISNIYLTLNTIFAKIDKKSIVNLRKSALIKATTSTELVKVAFDTRRFNQETDFNPRRNLQYYHRSDPFIDGNISDKIKTFFKLKIAVDSIKDDFIGDSAWLDSYARILSATVDRTLRIDQKDFDFFKPQIDYLEELLYLRYRLKRADIERLDERELRNFILDKDELLLHKEIYSNYNNGGINKTSNKIKFNETKEDLKESDRSITIIINNKP